VDETRPPGIVGRRHQKLHLMQTSVQRRDFRPLDRGPSRRRLGRMAVLTQPRVVSSPPDPWFRRHPTLALMVAGVLFAVVLSVRILAGSPVDAVSMLYALPVALVATTFGLRAGAAAGLIAVALTVFWAIARNVSLTPSGWVSRVLPLLLLGVLLGHAADRLRMAELGRRRLESAALLHREAGTRRPFSCGGSAQSEEAPAMSLPRRNPLGLTSTRLGSKFRPRAVARLIVTSSRSRTTSRLSIKSAVFQPS
jgi:hypothetical protein